MPLRYKLHNSNIIRWSLDPTRRSMVIYHKNPILNTIVYDVEFSVGEVKEYSENVIAEDLSSQVDDIF